MGCKGPLSKEFECYFTVLMSDASKSLMANVLAGSA